jgi:hypothetical protein
MPRSPGITGARCPQPQPTSGHPDAVVGVIPVRPIVAFARTFPIIALCPFAAFSFVTFHPHIVLVGQIVVILIDDTIASGGMRRRLLGKRDARHHPHRQKYNRSS